VLYIRFVGSRGYGLSATRSVFRTYRSTAQINMSKEWHEMMKEIIVCGAGYDFGYSACKQYLS
jgi:hypothetical protein